MILYRAVGLQELELIYESGMKVFPAHLPQQPIFYPVLQLEYARQVASNWNAKNGQFAGYVTQFKVEDEYSSQFEKHTVGGSQYQELWIPSENMEEFNRHISGHIKVQEAYFGEAFQGFVPQVFGMQGKTAVEQFTLLANSYIYKRMDFYLEIKRNHKAVFLNYPFWQTYNFKNQGLKEKVIQAIREAWITSFPKIPLPLPVPVHDDTPPAEQTDSPSFVNPDHQFITFAEETDSQQVNPDDDGMTSTEATEIHSMAEPVHENAGAEEQTRSHFTQGIKMGLSGQIHEAIEELSRAVEEDPGHGTARTSLGVAFRRVGEDDRALSCYETALQIDPKDAEAHYFRANILYSRRSVPAAIAGYTIAIGLKPELIEAHRNPLPLDRLTDYSPASAEMYWIAKPAYRILNLNKSLESNPRQAALFKERAAEYSRLWNYEQAIADYGSSLTIQPDDADALHFRGLAYEQLGQHDRALEDYRQAIAVDPHLSSAYINRGITFGKIGNFRQSIASLTEGIRLAPGNSDGYYNRGMTYLQLGDFEKAIEDYSRVIELSSNDEDAYYWRGICHEEAGRWREAITDYRQFLSISQNPQAREEVEEKLRQLREV